MFHAAPGADAFPLTGPSEDQGIDFAGIILFLKRRWKYIAGTTLIIAALMALALLQATPRYTATASVAVQSQKTEVVNVQDVLQGLAPDAATMETQAAIIRSDRLAGMLIDEMHLDHDPEFNPDIARSQHGFSLLDPSSWFGSSPVTPTAIGPVERAKIVRRVVLATDVTVVPRSYVITIAVTSRDADKAARMANALAEIYINDGIAAKYDATKRASTYLQKRVDELRGQTESADRAAELYRGRSGLIGSDQGTTVATQQLSEINTQLINARAERAAKEAQLSQIRALAAGGGSGGVEASAAILDSPLIQKLREQESEVVRNLAQLQATFGERHPKIINAEAELRDLRSKIADEVRKVAASTANDVAVSRAREATLQSSLNNLQGAVSAGGQASVRLRELQRESDANRSVYEVFLNRLKETNQQVDLQTADARVVSQAALPLRASFPKVGRSMLAALAIGLLAGLGLSFILERLDNTVRSAATLEAMGGGATLAFIPSVRGTYERPEQIVIERPEAMVSEALRTLRSALALSDVDHPPKVVMLSSSVPGEGKTFTSVGLSRVSAQSGARTILIDCDMRHPRVHKALAMHNDKGLVQVLSGDVALEDALQVDPDTGLQVLSAGHGAANPPDLLRSDHMAQLIKRLRQTYDFVVLDSPPFAILTDSQILTQLADKMLLVVRWGSVPVPVVHSTIKQIQRVKAPLVGAVLTRVNVDRHAKYGYGDYGYHYARYGNYYGTAA